MLRLTDFIIDCPDTMKLAAFYSEVTGRPVKEGSHENWAGIQLGGIELAFNVVEDYRAPQWPDSEHPKQFHLDFEVDDIEAEQTRVLALGATLQQDSIGPDGYGWRVYTDPIGHPFCLCRNKGAHLDRPGPHLVHERRVSVRNPAVAAFVRGPALVRPARPSWETPGHDRTARRDCHRLPRTARPCSGSTRHCSARSGSRTAPNG